MGKYPISSEFWPFSAFTPPMSRPFLALARAFMGEPRRLFRDKRLEVTRHRVGTSGGEEIEVLLLSPAGLPSPAPCLFYAHGGGFVLKAAPYHYDLAARYALECRCRVAFVQYRLAPRYPFPAAGEDCLAAYRWLLRNAEKLGVNPGNIGLGGDSAGSALAVGTALRLRDLEIGPAPRFLMLPYPFLDLSTSSEASKKFTDTPMWNSRLSRRVDRFTKPQGLGDAYFCFSPLEAPDLTGLPPAYIETAEFDCLRDDGTRFAARLASLGVPVELNETRGTMHGYDIVSRSPITRASVERRIAFMRRAFGA